MKFIEQLKSGLMDIQVMIRDGNLKPFLRPLLLGVIVFVLVWFLNKGTLSRLAEMRRKTDAQKAEIENEADYTRYKASYKRMLSTLPPFAQKEEWLLTQLYAIADKLHIRESMVLRKPNKEEDGIFFLYAVPVDVEVTYEQLGHLVEMIENSSTFMRISDLNIQRAEGTLGKLRTSFIVNTIFVNDPDFTDNKGAQ